MHPETNRLPWKGVRFSVVEISGEVLPPTKVAKRDSNGQALKTENRKLPLSNRLNHRFQQFRALFGEDVNFQIDCLANRTLAEGGVGEGVGD